MKSLTFVFVFVILAVTAVSCFDYNGGESVACNSFDFGADCGPNGECKLANRNATNGTCLCNDGYVNELGTGDVDDVCGYKQKKQLVGTLLEFFLGDFGAGYWYTGHTTLAIVRICLLVLWPVNFVWRVVQTIRFALDYVIDSHGVGLLRW